MTREEAIHILDNLKPTNVKSSFDAYIVGKALTMAIKALEPSGDAISRQAVNNLQRYRYNCGDTSITCISLKSVNDLPSVNPQYPKTGHWIDMDEGFSPCECSECKSVDFIKSKFCPNCGCRMESEDKE